MTTKSSTNQQNKLLTQHFVLVEHAVFGHELDDERRAVRMPQDPSAQLANAISDANPQETFDYVVRALNRFGLAYLHMVEGATGGSRDLAEGHSIDALRKLFDGPYMANNGYDRDLALEAVASGRADMVAYGRPYIANPDLAERLRRDAPLNQGDSKTYYGGGREGYTDYPNLADEAAA